MLRTVIRPLAVLSTTVALAACGNTDDSPESASSVGDASASSGLEHVHGLGINPSDSSLIIATHTGLFRAAEGEQQATPYGDSRQDVMGFSVLGPDRFIGSGHPDPQSNSLPPNLGLIRSTDAGRTFEPVSLLGEADFHVLESSGRRVYGFDGTQGRLMVSRDRGETWTQRTPPSAMIALAIDPDDPDRVIASTETGIQISRNAGETWRPVSEQLIGLLAWPAAERLYLVDGTGAVTVSADAGRTWTSAGTIGGQPASLMAYEDELYAALADGTITRSADGGETWQVRATP